MCAIQLKTPVAIIVFRRPEHTRKLLEALSRVQPERLLVIADGPRKTHPEDVRLCDQTRDLIDHLVTWDCDLTRAYADQNLGCGRRPSSGIDWVFTEVDEAIILEDDCIPGPSFFRFCEEILQRYREDERVMHVSGSTLRRNTIPVPDSYFFSAIPACWGWATWRRAWKHFDLSLAEWPTLKGSSWLEGILEDSRVVEYWSKIFDDAYAAHGRVSYWDYQWAFACWANSGLAAVPRANLVTNIGFGGDATHTLSQDVPYGNLAACELQFPLQHPSRVLASRDIDRRYLQEVAHPDLFSRGWGKWRKRVRRVTPAFVKSALHRVLAR